MGSIENSIKSNETRENIKRQFTYYLSNIARSARRTSDGYNLQSTAVQSFWGFWKRTNYLIMLQKNGSILKVCMTLRFLNK